MDRSTDQSQAWARFNGPLPLTEPELRQALEQAEADGLLQCAVCGARLRVDEARIVRRRLPQRWATLTAHAACAEALPPEAPPTPSPVFVDPPQIRPEVRATVGHLETTPGVPVLVFDFPVEEAVWQALDQVGLGDAASCAETDRSVGWEVSAVHSLFPDVPVLDGRSLTLAVTRGRADVYFNLGSGGVAIAAQAAPGSAVLPRGGTSDHFVALLYADQSAGGPDQPLVGLALNPALLGALSPHA